MLILKVIRILSGEYLMDSKCAAFWKHTNVRSDNKIFPCCRFKTPVDNFNGDLIHVLESSAYQELRNKSLNGEFIQGCEKCYYEDANGRRSLRQRLNDEYNTDTVELEFLEIGFDNICNLTCDGCWSDFSSEWSKKLNPDANKITHYRSIYDIVKVPSSIKKILFLGGEPLMTNRHEKFLKLIEDPSKVDVIYNTNGTFLLKEEFINFLRHFKSVTFTLSIDGYDTLNDKVRSGSKWNDILSFIEQVSTSNFTLEVNTVLHLNNWHGIKELESFIQKLGVPWIVNVLTFPTHLDISNFENKEQIINLINETNIPNKTYVINHLLHN
jgi:MoaA/NifB/PqqE/SkfB family radical SAM enzyme